MNIISDIIENGYNLLKQYYNIKKEKPQDYDINAFRIDRLIDGGRLIDDGGHNKQSIYVGMAISGDQSIRIGELGQPLYKLMQFNKTDNSLKYVFEDNVTLHFIRNNDNTIQYHLISNEIQQIDYFRLQYKTINMCTQDLDEIARLQSNKSILE